MKIDPTNKLFNYHHQQIVKLHPYLAYFSLMNGGISASFEVAWKFLYLRIPLMLFELITLLLISSKFIFVNLILLFLVLIGNLIAAILVVNKLLKMKF